MNNNIKLRKLIEVPSILETRNFVICFKGFDVISEV